MVYYIVLIMLFCLTLLSVHTRRAGYSTFKSWIWFLLLGVLVVNYAWEYFRGRALLNRWAEENGFEILYSRRPILNAGPFTWHTSRWQVVYSVRVRDRQGKDRSGWVKLGSFWGGLFSSQTEEWWKDEPES
jgi:hypothetical protein